MTVSHLNVPLPGRNRAILAIALLLVLRGLLPASLLSDGSGHVGEFDYDLVRGE